MTSYLISAAEGPNIRFEDFSEAWTPKTFGSVLQLISRSVKMNDADEYSLVTVKRRYEGVVQRDTYKGKSILVKSQFRLEAGDFIISKRQICHNACGIVPVSLEGSIVSNEYAVFEAKDNLFLPFFNYLCRLPKVSHTFYLSSIGVHIEKMLFKVDDWLRWKLPFPSLPEQQKIAAFLSAVDKKIQLLQRKKELLEQYKKGVMQKIFSQEIRFKDEDGNDYPDWEEKRVGEIAKVTAGGTPSTLKDEFWGGEIPWMNSGELNLKRVYDVQNHITTLGLNNSSTKLIPRECVLIGLAGQGKTRGTAAINYIELCTNQSIAAIYPNNKYFDSEYIYQVIDSKYEELRKLSTGDGGRGGLNLRIIKSIILLLPTVKEQQKISTFLRCMDDKIFLISKELDSSHQFKKGLLQQMFV